MPRFQFSLRTLLIVVTLLALPCWYVGAQYRIVAHRKALLAKIEFKDIGPAGFAMDLPALPMVRRWFGDEPVISIFPPRGLPPAEFQEIKDAFPEALVL